MTEHCQHTKPCTQCSMLLCAYCIEVCSGCEIEGCESCYLKHLEKCLDCPNLMCPNETQYIGGQPLCPACKYSKKNPN